MAPTDVPNVQPSAGHGSGVSPQHDPPSIQQVDRESILPSGDERPAAGTPAQAAARTHEQPHVVRADGPSIAPGTSVASGSQRWLIVAGHRPDLIKGLFKKEKDAWRGARPDIQLPRPRGFGLTLAKGDRPEYRLQSMEAINAAISALACPQTLNELRSIVLPFMDGWLSSVDRTRCAYFYIGHKHESIVSLALEMIVRARLAGEGRCRVLVEDHQVGFDRREPERAVIASRQHLPPSSGRNDWDTWGTILNPEGERMHRDIFVRSASEVHAKALDMPVEPFDLSRPDTKEPRTGVFLEDREEGMTTVAADTDAQIVIMIAGTMHLKAVCETFIARVGRSNVAAVGLLVPDPVGPPSFADDHRRLSYALRADGVLIIRPSEAMEAAPFDFHAFMDRL
jgi:hypothetical protein